MKIVSETGRPRFRGSFCLDVPLCIWRRKTSSHREGRWLTWAFTSPSFQLSSMLLLIFWSCVEAYMEVSCCILVVLFVLLQEGINPFSEMLKERDGDGSSNSKDSSYERNLQLCIKAA